MKTIIAGSRGITHFSVVEKAMLQCGFPTPTEIVSGTAPGADRLGEQWARTRNIPVKRMPADWDTYGKSAGYRRNEAMAQYVGSEGALVALWDGISPGTKHMIDIAKRHGLKVYVYQV